nr:G protein-coupled receptor [Proales similis]
MLLGFIPLALMLIGLLSNLLLCLVVCRRKSSSSSMFYLLALSLVSPIELTLTSVNEFLRSSFNLRLTDYSMIVCKLHSYSVNVSMQATGLIYAMAVIDLYAQWCLNEDPLRPIRRLASKESAAKWCAAILIASALINWHFLLLNGYWPASTELQFHCFLYPSGYQVLLKVAEYANILTYCVLPFASILIAGSMCLHKMLKKHTLDTSLIALSFKHKFIIECESNNLKRLTIAWLVASFLFLALAVSNHLVQFAWLHSEADHSVRLVLNIFAMLAQLQYASPFIVFSIIDSSFRRATLNVFKRSNGQ